jgi:uncharacterized protein
MNASENKRLMEGIFSEMTRGNSKPLVDSMDDDFCWIVSGTTPWSRKYEGKVAVIKELFAPLQSVLLAPITIIADRFIADEECVVVEARGSNTTRNGVSYHNRYCFVFRLVDGKLREVTEYMDTQLAVTVLGDPHSYQDKPAAKQTAW